MSIANQVKKILKDLSGIDTIQEEDTLLDTLSFDSFGMITLLIELEEAFQIELEQSDMDPFDLVTVQDVITLMEKYCGGQNEENS